MGLGPVLGGCNESRRSIMSDNKNPLDKPYSVALYKSLKYGCVMVSTYYGEKDAEWHGDGVRISEPIECRFTALTNDAVIQNALSSLEAEEHKARIELEKR